MFHCKWLVIIKKEYFSHQIESLKKAKILKWFFLNPQMEYLERSEVLACLSNVTPLCTIGWHYHIVEGVVTWEERFKARWNNIPTTTDVKIHLEFLLRFHSARLFGRCIKTKADEKLSRVDKLSESGSTHLSFKFSINASSVRSWRRTKSPTPNSGPSWILPAIFKSIPDRNSHLFLKEYNDNHGYHPPIAARMSIKAYV